jgi:hypothetical protein
MNGLLLDDDGVLSPSNLSYTNADPGLQPHLLFPRDKKEVFTFLNGEAKEKTTFGDIFTRSGRLVRGPLIMRPPQLEQAVYLDYEDELGMSDSACFFFFSRVPICSLRLTHEIRF